MTKIIGPQAIEPGTDKRGTGSETAAFIKFLSDPSTQIPLDSNFLVSFDTLPKALLDPNATVWSNLETNWKVTKNAETLLKVVQAQTNSTYGGQYLLFVQGFTSPGESVGTARSSVLGGPAGGLLSGIVSTERAQYGDLTIAFLETNKSFLDFVIRPWISLVSHYGLSTKKKNSVQNIKTDITAVFFDKNNKNAIRKKFTFYACAPVKMEEVDYSYGKNDSRIEKVKFAFNSYSISNE